MRIAVALPSRGIPCNSQSSRGDRITRAERATVPGSGNGVTAAERLRTTRGPRNYGLGEQATGIPIISSLETVQIGETDNGMPVYIDKHAATADGIIVINRIKEHGFQGALGEWLAQNIGGRIRANRAAPGDSNWGVANAMPAAARVVLARLPVLAGLESWRMVTTNPRELM